jgi:putative transposase
VKDEGLRGVMLRLQAARAKWSRLCALVEARRARVLARMKLQHYRTGTHTIHPEIGTSGLIVNESNSKYRYFLKVRKTDKKKDGHVYLPLLVDRKRIDPAALRSGASFLLKAAGRKVHIILTYEAAAPTFMPQGRTLGLDANTKHNLLQDSEGRAYDYDRLYLDTLLALLEKLDRVGTVNLDYRDRGRLRKLFLRNEWKLKTMLSAWIKGWAAEGVTDIVLEDLSISKDATFVRHDLHDVKYSRLLRLLRHSSLRTWLASMSEKQRIRVHTTHAAYTSQECPACHTIDRDNRKTQEEFECIGCGLKANADTNSAINLNARLTDDVLREDLIRLMLTDASRPDRCGTRRSGRRCLSDGEPLTVV